MIQFKVIPVVRYYPALLQQLYIALKAMAFPLSPHDFPTQLILVSEISQITRYYHSPFNLPYKNQGKQHVNIIISSTRKNTNGTWSIRC